MTWIFNLMFGLINDPEIILRIFISYYFYPFFVFKSKSNRKKNDLCRIIILESLIIKL